MRGAWAHCAVASGVCGGARRSTVQWAHAHALLLLLLLWALGGGAPAVARGAAPLLLCAVLYMRTYICIGTTQFFPFLNSAHRLVNAAHKMHIHITASQIAAFHTTDLSEPAGARHSDVCRRTLTQQQQLLTLVLGALLQSRLVSVARGRCRCLSRHIVDTLEYHSLTRSRISRRAARRHPRRPSQEHWPHARASRLSFAAPQRRRRLPMRLRPVAWAPLVVGRAASPKGLGHGRPSSSPGRAEACTPDAVTALRAQAGTVHGGDRVQPPQVGPVRRTVQRTRPAPPAAAGGSRVSKNRRQVAPKFRDEGMNNTNTPPRQTTDRARRRFNSPPVCRL